MPAEASKPHIVSITRDGKFQICYAVSDGAESAFRVIPAMADFIESAWAARTSRPEDQLGAMIQELTQIVKGMG